ncbi:DUF6415 family natural product biosynthesis protein [Streptomyces sp. NPDC002790]|uniref:DUF6415 family natural product biosynthesis protein n=1 Tax=Streptomyces sp. NPDC002790 TaxID=3154431 RepID=UPI0033280B69
MAARRASRRLFAPGKPVGASLEPGPQRDPSAAALETVALVLDEAAPLPESADDVEELAQRLRGHISQLGLVVPPGASGLRSAQQLASAGVPDGYMPSRVHLVKLAEATQALVATVQAHGVDLAKPTRRRRWRSRGSACCAARSSRLRSPV